MAVINIEDVFDEFSYGTHTPQAIKDFMLWAKQLGAIAELSPVSGRRQLRRAQLYGRGNFDFVPTKQIDTGAAGAQTALETASDDWLLILITMGSLIFRWAVCS